MQHWAGICSLLSSVISRLIRYCFASGGTSSQAHNPANYIWSPFHSCVYILQVITTLMHTTNSYLAHTTRQISHHRVREQAPSTRFGQKVVWDDPDHQSLRAMMTTLKLIMFHFYHHQSEATSLTSILAVDLSMWYLSATFWALDAIIEVYCRRLSSRIED